jgi:hypothetical protein
MIDTCFIINDQLQIVDTLVPFKNKGSVATITRINDNKWLVEPPGNTFYIIQMIKTIIPPHTKRYAVGKKANVSVLR